MMDQRSFSALILVSILTLAAPMLSRQADLDMGAADRELREALDARTLPSRAHAWLDDMAAFFEQDGYGMASAQLWAASGAPDFGAGSIWAVAPPPAPHLHAPSSAAS